MMYAYKAFLYEVVYVVLQLYIFIHGLKWSVLCVCAIIFVQTLR